MGYQNGQIPAENLREIPWAPGHYLVDTTWCDAKAMNEAHLREKGRNLPINDAYRSMARQNQYWVRYGRNPMRAARPGTSNHGWAKALDINVGGQQSETRMWLYRNGPRFGFVQPPYYASLTKSPEPWHWEHLSDSIVSARGKEIYRELQEDIVASIQDLERVVDARVNVDQIAKRVAEVLLLWPVQRVKNGVDDRGKNFVDVVADVHEQTSKGSVARAVLFNSYADHAQVNGDLATRTGWIDRRVDKSEADIVVLADQVADLKSSLDEIKGLLGQIVAKTAGGA